MTEPCIYEKRLVTLERAVEGVQQDVWHQHEDIGKLTDSVKQIVEEMQGFRKDVREAMASMGRVTGQASVVRWFISGGGFGAVIAFTKFMGWL